MSTRVTAVVTGATGFIGSRVVSALLEAGASIRAITSGSTSKDRLGDMQSQVTWYGSSESDLMQAAKGATHFFNWAVVYDRPEISDQLIDDVNVRLPLRMLQCLKAQGASVTCILGDTFFRKYPPQATRQARYTRSKQMLLEEVERFDLTQCMRIAFLQIEQVYGSGEALTKVFPSMVGKMLANVERLALTTGSQRRDFIHADDVMRAALTVMVAANWRGKIVVECGSGESHSVRSVFERLHALASSTSILGFGDMPSDQSINDSVADITWLRSHGWAPSVTLEEGLSGMVKDVATRMLQAA